LIIPDILRRHAAAAGAEAWLDELPAVVRHLEQRWNIAVGGPFSGATAAYVVEATTVDGQAVVAKVLLPSNPNAARHEITALRLADGEGCVALLRDDPELGALLLERLGTSPCWPHRRSKVSMAALACCSTRTDPPPIQRITSRSALMALSGATSSSRQRRRTSRAVTRLIIRACLRTHPGCGFAADSNHC